MRKLSGKQKAFCREYIVNHNGTQSAIKAGYSEKTANRIASENLTKPDIKNEIERLEKENIQKVEITVEEILTELKRIAFELQDEKLTYRNKLRAIELLGKHLGMFVEKHEISAKVDQRVVKVEMEIDKFFGE